MKKVIHISEKLKDLRKSNNYSQLELAKLLGVGRTQITNYESGSNIPEATLKKYAEIFDMSIEELTVFPKNDDKKNGIPYFDVDATASNVDIFNDGLEFISEYMNVVGFNDCDFACNVAGDSMTPYLNSGDIIMCKKITDLSFFNYGETYLIVTPEQRLVKTLRKADKEDFVRLVSKNPEHDPFEIPKSKILNLFIVKGRIERKIL